ncbi:hypothetical protein F4774DRAFT_424825 [Daldinia eschscholtzii]|nr:hypothetical protein F4774DRAFT_424825 [Daldinia eschscholtzii]
MATNNTQASMEARERGNVLYRKGRFNDASKEYLKAAAMAPSDPSPLSNLSAVSFETGKYTECIEFATKALSLLKAGPANDTLKQKLLMRQAKAYLHLSSFNDAEDALDQLVPGKEVNDLRDSVKELREIDGFPQQQELLLETLVQLPRWKLCINDEPEYFCFGNDYAKSVYTAELEKSAGKDPVLSIMFCDVSDARHVFHTILQYAVNKKGSQKLHITMVDHKPIVVARDLVFISLLLEAAANQGSRDVALLSLSYAYCAQVIPPFVWDKLQDTVNKLLDRLEKKQQPTEMVYLPTQQIDGVMAVLKSWQGALLTMYKTSEIRRYVAEHDVLAHGEELDMFSKFVIDKRTFNDFSVLFPPQDMLPSLEPGLSTLFADYQTRKQGAQKRLSDYLDKHWKVNFTVLDAKMHARLEEEALDVLERHPFSVIASTLEQLSAVRARGGSMYCLKHMKDFFEKVSLNLVQLRGRLTMEMIVSDMAEVLERMRYGILDRPKQKGDAGNTDLSTTIDWPLRYHLIHLNNIPDFCGGSLTSFLYGPPVLKKGVGSGLTLCSLKGWENIDHFNSESLLMHDQKLIEKHFQVKLAKEHSRQETFMFQYYRWEKSETGCQSLDKLMPRESFFRWLFAHYLKLCIPFPRPPNELCLFASLNITTFTRLLVQMGELGYPGHWLSSIITSLSRGTVTTTARAPRSKLLEPSVVDKVYPSRTICVKPWSAELTTLIAQWRSLIPYTVVVPSGLLPPPEAIIEYSVKIPHTWAPYLDCPEFILVFWNARKYPVPPRDLYAVVLDDERGSKAPIMQEMREDGFHILTTVDYVMDTCTATFWLRSDVMESMLRENWSVFIGRTDMWTRHSPAHPLRYVLLKKRTWKECVTA